MFLAQLYRDILGDKWEITKKAEGNNDQVFLIRNGKDRKYLAILKTYQNTDIKYYSRELKALKVLTGKIILIFETLFQ